MSASCPVCAGSDKTKMESPVRKRGMESNALKRENGCNSSGCSKKNFFLVIPVSLVFYPSHEPLWEGLQTSGTPVAGQEINGEYRCESGAVPPL